MRIHVLKHVYRRATRVGRVTHLDIDTHRSLLLALGVKSLVMLYIYVICIYIYKYAYMYI
jgi:hypothetical protein